MKRLALAAILMIAFSIPTLAGEVPTVGKAETPQPTPTPTTTTNTSTGITATILLTIISLVSR